jgi:hypothetical protein
MALTSHTFSLAPALDDEIARTARAAARIRVVRLLMVTYVLLIIEGALRKWALESVQKAIFFIRDPFILAIYVIAWRHRLVPPTPLFSLLMIMTVGFIVLAGLQVAFINLNPLVAAYGLRNYLLVLWLVPVMAAVLTRRHIMSFVRLTLIFAVPMAVLSFIQWRSPVNSYINKGFGDSEIFTVVGGVVRATGTFSFTAGFVCFTCSVIACLAAYFFARSRSLPLLAAGLAAAVTCQAASGSRTAYVGAGVTCLAVVLSEVVRPIAKQRPLVYLATIGGPLVFCVAMAVIFPDAIAMMLARQEAAAHVEDPMVRFLGNLLDGFQVLEQAGPLGLGVGFGTNGGALLRGSGVQHFTLAEVEFSRVIQECGMIMGMGYMLLRWGLCLWLLTRAVRCIRQHDDSVPLMLLSFTAPLLIIGQITMQGSINGYGWFFTGLTLAAVATSTPQDEAHDG